MTTTDQYELERLRTALAFYANRANWTDHHDWPTDPTGRGENVFSRASVRHDMDTPGWIEAQEALDPTCGARRAFEEAEAARRKMQEGMWGLHQFRDYGTTFNWGNG
jgi:hypothetical protein